ncbi:MAG: hypothetical protein AB1798_13960 [Spirochaetota bacterium]
MKTFPLQLDDELHKQLKIQAVQTGQTLHELIVRILKQEIEKDGEIVHGKSSATTTGDRSNAS